MSESKTILILSANPSNTTRLRLDEEFREIEEGLRRSKRRDLFNLQSKWAVRLKDLRRAMLDYEPQIVHFCGHGEENGIVVENDNGQSVVVDTLALAGLFELFKDRLNCVVLNACYSEQQATAINQHVKYVIGMKKGISDRAAIEFVTGFYDALGNGKSVEDSFKFGCNAIQLYGLPEHLTPVLKTSGVEKKKYPLIFRSGKIINSVNELMDFARTNPNTIKGESRAISLWIESLGYSVGERMELEMKIHLATLGVKPDEVTSDMLPDFLAGPIASHKVIESDSPPPIARIGDRWINPIDQSEMVYVPAGEFLRGNPQDKITLILQKLGVPNEKIPEFYDETPEQIIYLDGFWIDRYATTNSQFAMFLEETNALKNCKSEEDKYRYSRIIEHGKGMGAEYPISDISWFEAKQYCEWANKNLPSEAQWEKAARGGQDDRIFPWGNTLDPSMMNTIESSQPFPDGVKVNVNRSNLSPFGCIQMVGNVGEWCLDNYDPQFYSRVESKNPICLVSAGRQFKVIRGGGTTKPIAYARCSSRDYAPPEIKPDFIGFRGICVAKS